MATDAPAETPKKLNKAGRVSGGARKRPEDCATLKPAARTRLASLIRVAAATGIPYTTWRDIVARREIPVVKVGRLTFVEWVDVDGWIARRKGTAA